MRFEKTTVTLVKEILVSPTTFNEEDHISLVSGLSTLNNLNSQLLNRGLVNHVTSGPTVDGNMNVLVVIKCG